MPSPCEIRVLLSSILTKLEELQDRESTANRLSETEGVIAQLKDQLPKDVLGNQAGSWNLITNDEQDELLSRLNDAYDRLLAIEARGRRPSADELTSIKRYAIGMFVGFLVIIFLCICEGAIPGIVNAGGNVETVPATPEGEAPPAVVADADTADADKADPHRSTAHPAFSYLMLLGLGGFGACVRLLASLARHIGNDRFSRTWLSYYYFMPFEGAGMALVVCLLLGAGIIAPNGGNSAPGGHATGLLFVYGMAGIAGMFSQNVSAKLRELSIALFGRPNNEGSN